MKYLIFGFSLAYGMKTVAICHPHYTQSTDDVDIYTFVPPF